MHLIVDTLKFNVDGANKLVFVLQSIVKYTNAAATTITVLHEKKDPEIMAAIEFDVNLMILLLGEWIVKVDRLLQKEPDHSVGFILLENKLFFSSIV